MTPLTILALCIIAVSALFLAAYWATERSLAKHTRQADAYLTSARDVSFDAVWDDVERLETHR